MTTMQELLVCLCRKTRPEELNGKLLEVFNYFEHLGGYMGVGSQEGRMLGLEMILAVAQEEGLGKAEVCKAVAVIIGADRLPNSAADECRPNKASKCVSQLRR